MQFYYSLWTIVKYKNSVPSTIMYVFTYVLKQQSYKITDVSRKRQFAFNMNLL